MNLVVPICYRTPKSKINLKVITYVCLTAMIILFTMLIGRLCGLTRVLWTPFYVFRLLFGIVVNEQPKKLFEKFIYISFAVISIQ